MIYALSADDGGLHVFPNASEAISYCEGYDVAGGLWCFFSADGGPLEAVFSEPARKYTFTISHGIYHLRPSVGLKLQDRFSEIRYVEGPAGQQSLEAVAAALTRSDQQDDIDRRATAFIEWVEAPDPKPDAPEWTDYPWDRQTAEDAWPVILQILRMRPSDLVISVLAAGPLEDTIGLWGPEFIERIEQEARSNADFRNLLDGVWQSGTQEIWHRLNACGASLGSWRIALTASHGR